MKTTVTTSVGGRQVTIETGRMAKQADGSVVVSCGNNIVLVTAVASRKETTLDYFPLMVEYQEKYYATGKIPGGYFKREGRPTTDAILTARLIDRPIRPKFPEGFRCETQVVATVLSADGAFPVEILASVGASAALHISDIPFDGPTAAVQVGRVDGQLIANPTPQQMERSDLDIIVAGTRQGILMVEGEAKLISEADTMAALRFGHQSLLPFLNAQDELREKTGSKPKRSFNPPAVDEGFRKEAEAFLEPMIKKALETREKMERYAAVDQAAAQARTGDHFRRRSQLAARQLARARQRRIRSHADRPFRPPPPRCRLRRSSRVRHRPHRNRDDALAARRRLDARTSPLTSTSIQHQQRGSRNESRTGRTMSILEVPGADLYYESVGHGPPLVLIPGGNGTAHIFGPIAQHLAERYTVITYDRRGFARSHLNDTQDYRRRLKTDADDTLALIERVADEPATVFGPSSGAVVGLQAVTQRPTLVNKLVAYEPPAMKQLPDGQQWLDLCDQVYDLYQRAGIPPALKLFNEQFFPPQDVAFLNRLRDISQPQVRDAVEYWFEHELRQYTAVDLDVDALQANTIRVTVAVGRDSRSYPLHDICTTLANTLSQPLPELPGGHTGYATHPAEFASALVDLLDATLITS